MKILIADDEPDITDLIRDAFTAQGFVVETCNNGEDALWMATEFDFDVVVLDWVLPGPDGISVCRQLRERDRWMPVLMLSGQSGVAHRVDGLQAGADDYLTKPFALEELAARIQALARRAPAPRPNVLQVGDLSLDPSSQRVTRQGEPINLRGKEYLLLELFMRHPDTALSRSRIIDQLWDSCYDGMSNVVDVHVKALRAKVDRPFNRASIETVYGVGYRLNSAAADA